MTRRTKKTAGSAIALAAASALLAGCFTVDATFTIKDDATADLDYLILIDTEQLQEFSGLLGEDAPTPDEFSADALLGEITGDDDPCGDLTAELTEYDVSVREIDENGEVGVGCMVSDVPIAELNSLGDDTSSFSIEQDNQGTRFNAVLEGVDELAGDPAETDDMTEMLGVTLDDLFTIRFTVSAPGSLGENNASTTDGSTATWDLKPDSDFVTDGDATMTAEWTPGGGGSSTGIIIAIVAALVAAAAVAIVLSKRSKGEPDETAAADRHPDGPSRPHTASARHDCATPASTRVAECSAASTSGHPGTAGRTAEHTTASATPVLTSGAGQLHQRNVQSPIGTIAPRRSPTTCWRST